MDGKVHLQDADRKTLLEYYRKHPDPAVRPRAHIILLLTAGYPWMIIASTLLCSTHTISRWKQRWLRDGLAGVTDERRGRRAIVLVFWVALDRRWIQDHKPRDVGCLSSRRCCRVVVVLSLEIHAVSVSEETARRWLHRPNAVWRRPRPLLGPLDPQRAAKIQAIHRFLAHLGDHEIARNRRCQSTAELLDLVFAWIEGRQRPFWFETSDLPRPRPAISTAPQCSTRRIYK